MSTCRNHTSDKPSTHIPRNRQYPSTHRRRILGLLTSCTQHTPDLMTSRCPISPTLLHKPPPIVLKHPNRLHFRSIHRLTKRSSTSPRQNSQRRISSHIQFNHPLLRDSHQRFNIGF